MYLVHYIENMLAYLLALFCLTLLHLDTGKLPVIMSLLFLVSRRKSHVLSKMPSLRATLLQLLFSLPLSEFQEEVCGYRRAPTSCMFFFLKEDLPNLWVMFVGLLPYLKHLERYEANYSYFLLISDLIAGPRHALQKLAPTLSDIKSPARLFQAVIYAQCPPMTPWMLILNEDFWTC